MSGKEIKGKSPILNNLSVNRDKVWPQLTTEEYKKKLARALAKGYKKKQGTN